MITFIDDYYRYVWVDFMKEKSEVINKFQQFKEAMEKKVGRKVQCLRTDNGGEYTSAEFSHYLQDRKIRRQLTCPNTPKKWSSREKESTPSRDM